MSAIYEAIYGSDLVEELHQTEAKEYWFRAIATLGNFFHVSPTEGILFTHNPQTLSNLQAASPHLQTWVFTPSTTSLLIANSLPILNIQTVTLAETDALQGEWFCILITNLCSALLVSSDQHYSCLFSLHPEPIAIALKILEQRVEKPYQAQLLQTQLSSFSLRVPSYQVMARFGSFLFTQSVNRELPIPEIQEIDLIRALTHEIKTPLTTIKTLIHSLLRRKDIEGIRSRLEKIAWECTEQIERFNLIFDAAQLTAYPITLETTNLVEIFTQSLERWQKQALRRQLTLDITLPSTLPAIVSHAKLLSQILNGLVDKLTRTLPTGSHIHLQVEPMGEHIKLQFQAHTDQNDEQNPVGVSSHVLKAVGQWLMLQPETGTLSLSLPITKTLFQAIGGKFTVRLHPNSSAYDGEILTIFLPIERL